jgi:cephalosporin hydroxylase
MNHDKGLLDRAFDAKGQDNHDLMWVHQSREMSEPCLQQHTDALSVACVLVGSRPAYSIAFGVAEGDFSLFPATLFPSTGGENAVDIESCIPDDWPERTSPNPVAYERMTLVEGPSIDSATDEWVRETTSEWTTTRALLDFEHTTARALVGMRGYEVFVGPCQCLICCDTASEPPSPATNRPSEWGEGHDRASAPAEFHESEAGDSFASVKVLGKSSLISNNCGEYIRRGL